MRRRYGSSGPIHPEGFGPGASSGYGDFRYGGSRGRPITLATPMRPKPIFSQKQRAAIVARLADQFSEWRLSPFEKEGPFTTALRSNLCLAGYAWTSSDAEATAIVGRALLDLGIPRPTDAEGKPDYLDSPDRCSWCACPVEDVGNGKASRFCSSVCAKSAIESRDFVRRSDHDRAYAAAARALRKSRTSSRACEFCGTSFQPIREKSKQRFCSFSCGAKGATRTKPPFALASTSVVMACAYCGGDFGTRNRKAIVCSKTCSEAWGKIRKGKEPQRLRPHVFDRYITSRVDPPRLNGARFDFLLWQAGATITAEAAMPQPGITNHLFA